MALINENPKIKGVLLESKLNGLGLEYGKIYEVHTVVEYDKYMKLYFIDDLGVDDFVLFDKFDPTYNEDIFNVYFQF